ncbi:MAG: PSD1 and planctomycete cytochrome C domain-containing protein [Isosphaeraceae bacterium]
MSGLCAMKRAMVLALLLGASTVRASGPEPTFERDARPILKAYCLDCHGAGEKPKGGLDLRLRRFVLKGGESGPALEPGKPEESLLLERIRDGEMPPGEKKVPPEQVAILERWIASGARAARNEPETLAPGIDITPEERDFWAFRPIQRPALPAAQPEDGVRTPIDAFIVAKLRANGLRLAPEADRATLIRRASFDLVGLPPSPQEVDAFVADPSPLAYERMIDRLLASPRYGERWARHWLDVAGYADSEGNGNEDSIRPYAYRYRDYVIRAFNSDRPLDRFVIEQLAGDELLPRPWSNLTPPQIELLAATGFLRNAADPTATGSPDEALAANQVVADTLKIVGSTLLGLTIGCAQCHDHRYDPVPQSDYFRLRAIFEPALDPQHWRRPGQRLISLYTDADRARAAAIDAEANAMQQALDAKTRKYVDEAFEANLGKFPEPLRKPLSEAFHAPEASRTAAQNALLDANPSARITPGVLYQYNQKAADELTKEAQKVAAKRAEKKPEEFVSVLDETPGVVPETRLFHRGDHRQPTRPLGPGDLTIAAPEGTRVDLPAKDPSLPTTGRRLAYAKYLMNGRHPLVGRVLANRIWLGHFGRGIVDTPGDFGTLGTRPSHPELLDWLASELVDRGWSLKAMHRLIMTSSVYRQASTRTPAQDRLDTENALYGHFPIRRLDAETLRDRVLVAAGRLDATPFGPPIPVAEDFVGQVLPANDSGRRSLYLQVRRSKPVSLLATFDGPIMTVNCEKRQASVSAPQSLMLMNSDFMLTHAGKVARRALTETPAGYQATETSKVAVRFAATDVGAAAPGRTAERVAFLWRLVYLRSIAPEELDLASAFVADRMASLKRAGTKEDAELTALTSLAQQLLISNEFLYVD